MARTLGSDHDHVHAGRRDDLFKVDIKTMGKAQGLSVGQIFPDIVFIKNRLLFIVYQDHDDIGGLYGVSGIHYSKAVLFCLYGRFRALIQTHHHVTAGIP